MSPAVIIERIRASLAAGELAPSQPPIEVPPLTTVGDLLRPVEELFPGVRRDDEERRDIFGYKGLRKPRFRPSPRRSRRPLAVPRRTPAPNKAISSDLFVSLSAVWQWYERRGLADPALILAPLTHDAINQFVTPLYNEMSDYYPLNVCLEEYALCGDVLVDTGPVCLILPHLTWEHEEVGVFEAFLCGADGLLGLLRTLVEREDFINLPEEDLELIERVGYADLAGCYAAFDGEKSLDVSGLEEWPITYFGEVAAKYPTVNVADIPVIISDPSEVEVYVRTPEDIDFAIDYAAAWEVMTGVQAMPWPAHVDENSDRAADKLVHEVCEVWRKKHRKKSVPLGATLVELYRNGKL